MPHHKFSRNTILEPGENLFFLKSETKFDQGVRFVLDACAYIHIMYLFENLFLLTGSPLPLYKFAHCKVTPCQICLLIYIYTPNVLNA